MPECKQEVMTITSDNIIFPHARLVSLYMISRGISLYNSKKFNMMKTIITIHIHSRPLVDNKKISLLCFKKKIVININFRLNRMPGGNARKFLLKIIMCQFHMTYLSISP